MLYAHNDDMAIGAIQAIEEFGLKPGKDIVIVSIDSVKGAFEAMIAGKLNCSVECSPLLVITSYSIHYTKLYDLSHSLFGERLIPISSPRLSTSAPPELPGLMAASVWM